MRPHHSHTYPMWKATCSVQGYRWLPIQGPKRHPGWCHWVLLFIGIIAGEPKKQRKGIGSQFLGVWDVVLGNILGVTCEFIIIINISIISKVMLHLSCPSNFVSLMLRKASMMEKGQGDESKKSSAPSFPKTVVE